MVLGVVGAGGLVVWVLGLLLLRVLGRWCWVLWVLVAWLLGVMVGQGQGQGQGRVVWLVVVCVVDGVSQPRRSPPYPASTTRFIARLYSRHESRPRPSTRPLFARRPCPIRPPLRVPSPQAASAVGGAKAVPSPQAASAVIRGVCWGGGGTRGGGGRRVVLAGAGFGGAGLMCRFGCCVVVLGCPCPCPCPCPCLGCSIHL